MHNLLEGHNFRISWYDDAQTILYFEVLGAWTWDEVSTPFNYINQDVLAKRSTPTYVITHFAPKTNVLPYGHGSSALNTLRNLVSQNYDSEQLNISVAAGAFVETLVQLVRRMNIPLQAVMGKYRFVATLDEALQIIAAHKAQTAAQAPPNM
jgi:hypothetical protein